MTIEDITSDDVLGDTSLDTTAALVVLAQAGEGDAFGRLVERFERMVQAVCWQRLKNYVEVEEVTQDVFIKAFEKLDQLREPEAFAGWLRSIALRQSINRCTRQGPWISVEPQTFDGYESTVEHPLDGLLTEERHSQLREGLDRLAQLDRSTLVAFYLQGRSLVQMSDEFSAPVGTIKRRLHVARKRLARELECLQAV